MNSYHVLELVGEGSFGRVYKGRKKFTGQVVALKFMPKVGRSVRELQNLKREIDIMRDLQHPNIVQLFDSFETDTEVVVVTEYAEGQLFQILEDDGSLPESQVREIACQLVSSLYYLHSHRILHRDMKPQNILLDKNGVVKLCDFGFARSMSVSTMVLTSIKGTPLYMSPELVEEKPYDHTADLWSLGCILYELHTGAPPFYTNSILHLVQLIIKDQVKWADTMSETCTSFLKGLLTKDPQKRLSWPELLHHPFVADNVLVLSDTNIFSPLTVAPSPDMLVLKLKQMAAKTLPASGESRLLRKVREQKENINREKADGSDAMKKKKKDGQGAERTAATATAAGRPASGDAAVMRASQSGSPKNTGCPTPKHRGQISRDFEREFPSVEVGPRLQRRRKEESQDADDREDYWEKLAEASDPNRREPLNHRAVLPKLKSTILAFKAQLTGGAAIERRHIEDPLRFLQNLILTSDPEMLSHVGVEVGLPRVLFDLLRDCLESLQFVKQSWCVEVLGGMMVVLLTYWDNHCNWVEEEEEQSLKEFCKPFITILNQPGLSPLAPLAASLLSLFVQHDVEVRVNAERLTSLLRSSALDSHQPRLPPPGGRGLCDGLLALSVHSLYEDDGASGSAGPDVVLSVNLWQKIDASLAEPTQDGDFCSANGLYSFLSAALFVFTKDPYSCVPLFAASESKCVSTLSRLLGTDCLHLFAEGPSRLWAHVDHDSCSVLSCHLLCFPFALDLPPHNMSAILQSYHGAGVVTGLLQVIPVLPPPLVELHLSLLIRLLLCDPERAASRLPEAARGFFSGKSPRSRSAARLLSELLQQDGLWDGAVELLTLLALAARLTRPAGVRFHLEAPALQQALAHSCEQIRAAACKLLGNLDPFGSAAPPGLRSDIFKSLIERLRDPCMSVRRAACRAAGSWLGYIAVAAGKREEAGGDRPAILEDEEGRAWLGEARGAAATLASLVTNPDALTRRHACAALGNLVNAEGAAAVLLQEGVSALLLRAACTDSHNAVRQAAIATLRLYSKQGAIRQVLISLGAAEELLRAGERHAAPQGEYQQLVRELEVGLNAS